MPSFKLNGIVHKVCDAETKGTFTFRNLQLRVDTDGKFPQVVEVQFSQANVDKLDPIREGQEVEVEFNLRGREYNGKVYNSLSGWKIAVTGKAAEFEQPKNAIDNYKKSGETFTVPDSDAADSLPF